MALLNALAVVFPDLHHLQCVWHINKNFITQLKKSSLSHEDQEEVTKMWNLLVQATTEHEYEVFLLALKDFLFNRDLSFMNYLSKTWLVYKEKFVAHWANKILHFGNIATSRVEGGHGLLKKFIDKTSYDLVTFFQHLNLFLKHQLAKVTVTIGSERTKHLNEARLCFSGNHGKVSQFAIKKAIKQFGLISNDLGPCTHSFSSAWGIPCAHKIRESFDQTDVLDISLFNYQWHLTLDHDHLTLADLQASFIAKAQRIASPLSFHSLLKLNDELSLLETGNFALIPITEPSVKINTRGRPNKSQSQHSTRRDLSSWEITRLRPQKCGRCGQLGHNRRSCHGEALTEEERMLDNDDDDEAEAEDAQGEDDDDGEGEDAQGEDND
jgi:hypothetical protein